MSAPAAAPTKPNIKYGLISADDHVVETPDLWTSRVPANLKDRVPHIERQADGSERWVCDGQVLLGGKVASVGALMTDRTKEPARWQDVPAAAYQPGERLKAMDAAGVDYSALYPMVSGLAGQAFASITDPELELACVQAYNDWLIEEWGAASERFLPQCIVPVWPPDATVKEIERCLAKGHKGVVFPAVPMHLREVPHVSDADYDVVWSAIEKAGVPLCLHAGSSPKLQYPPLSAHSWGMLYMEWADHQFEHDGLPREGYDLKPSEMFHRQCYFVSWFDEVAPYADHLGIDNILWATNFPLPTSTWPRTGEVIDRCFRGLSRENREKVLWRSAAELYRL